MIKIISVVLISAIFSSFGQIFFKLASNKAGQLKHGKKALIRHVGKVLQSAWTGFGLLLMGISLMIWLIAMAQGDLSLIYPIGSLYYIFVIVLAHVFLGEKIDRSKIFGTLFIFAGIVLMTKS